MQQPLAYTSSYGILGGLIMEGLKSKGVYKTEQKKGFKTGFSSVEQNTFCIYWCLQNIMNQFIHLNQ